MPSETDMTPERHDPADGWHPRHLHISLTAYAATGRAWLPMGGPGSGSRTRRSAVTQASSLLLGAGLLLIAAVALAMPSTVVSSAILVASAATIVILIKPWTGLVILAFVLPFAPAFRTRLPLQLGPVALDVSDLLLALVLVAWLAQSIGRRDLSVPPLREAPLALPLLILLGAAGLSLLNASSYQDALPEIAKWVQVLLLYWCAAAILPLKRVPWVLAAMIAAGTGQALMGMYQFVYQSGPEAFVFLGRYMRAYGAFSQPNPYAGYLGLVAPLAISLAIWAWTSNDGSNQSNRRLAAILLTVSAGVISTGLLLSWSRGAWLAFAGALVTIIVAVALNRRSALTRNPSAPLLLGAIVLLLTMLAVTLGAADALPTTLAERLGDLNEYAGLFDVQRIEVDDANFAVVERVAHWQAALGMWTSRPWLGVGIGNYAASYASFALPRWQEALGHAHNAYLNFAAETGLLGLLAYLAFWILAIREALRAIRPARFAPRSPQSRRFGPSQMTFAAAVGAGVLGVLAHATVHNLFDYLWVQHIYLHLALLLGLLAVLLTDASQPRDRASLGPRSPAR